MEWSSSPLHAQFWKFPRTNNDSAHLLGIYWNSIGSWKLLGYSESICATHDIDWTSYTTAEAWMPTSCIAQWVLLNSAQYIGLIRAHWRLPMFRSPFLSGVELETALSNSAQARMTLASSKEMNEESRTMWVGWVYDRGLDVVRHFVKTQRVCRPVGRKVCN